MRFFYCESLTAYLMVNLYLFAKYILVICFSMADMDNVYDMKILSFFRDLIILIGELADNLNNVCSHIRLIEDHAQNSFLQRSVSYYVVKFLIVQFFSIGA